MTDQIADTVRDHAERIKQWADTLVASWSVNPYEIHKRPPFRAHPFDTSDRFWVVGSNYVSVLGGWFGLEEDAATLAAALNDAAQSQEAE